MIETNIDDQPGDDMNENDCETCIHAYRAVDLCLTDPPYGVGLDKWDEKQVNWINIHPANHLLFTPGIRNVRKFERDWMICWGKTEIAFNDNVFYKIEKCKGRILGIPVRVRNTSSTVRFDPLVEIRDLRNEKGKLEYALNRIEDAWHAADNEECSLIEFFKDVYELLAIGVMEGNGVLHKEYQIPDKEKKERELLEEMDKPGFLIKSKTKDPCDGCNIDENPHCPVLANKKKYGGVSVSVWICASLLHSCSNRALNEGGNWEHKKAFNECIVKLPFEPGDSYGMGKTMKCLHDDEMVSFRLLRIQNSAAGKDKPNDIISEINRERIHKDICEEYGGDSE